VIFDVVEFSQEYSLTSRKFMTGEVKTPLILSLDLSLTQSLVLIPAEMIIYGSLKLKLVVPHVTNSIGTLVLTLTIGSLLQINVYYLFPL
jgi:hypothetical protein